jgi:tRNA-2-methylthio-N6-dimethylallyladenosine synthase
LKAMRRGHTAEAYCRRIDAIKQAKRQLAVTSDIIVGFPGESDSDFESTMRLVEKCQYDGLYIFKYSRRAGTPAALLADEIPEHEKTARFLALEQLQESIQEKVYADYVGKQLSVLVEKESARSPEDMTGHSTCHKVVNFRAHQTPPGAIVDVLIKQAKSYSLYGALITSKSAN